MFVALRLCSVLVALAASPGLDGAAHAALPPLVPRELFFGNPVKTTPRVSPDGKRLAYLAPSDKNVMNVWLRSIGRRDDRMVTHDIARGIRTYYWAEDNQHLLYLQDVGGDENFHVYAVDLGTDAMKDLTPQPGVRAQFVYTDRRHPHEVLVTLNARDRKVFDVHRIDLVSGASRLDTENPGDVAYWLADPNFVVRVGVAQDSLGGTVVRVRDDASAPWRELIHASYEENVSVEEFARDGHSIYVSSSLGSDVQRFVRVDLATGAELETLASDPRCDNWNVMIDSDSLRPQAVSFNYQHDEWKVLDPSVAPDFARLGELHAGDFDVVSRDHGDRTWIVSYAVDDGPVAYYAYDRRTKQGTRLFVDRPALANVALAKREPVIIPARDGLELVSYLTKPVGVPSKGLPMVVLVHGGPWSRDSWRFDATAEWLANRGYAVLQVNYRGSIGFGKKFLHAGDREWGGRMQDDLTDAVHWAIARGIADPKRVAIMGGSYGGYATLAGLAFTSELYACGIDIVGPSNLRTFLATIPPYWYAMRRLYDVRMGDVEGDSLLNRRCSPLFHVERIRAPLLIGQGRNDPRVNIRESDQIVATMRAKRLPVEYVVYADEGHGLQRPENRLDFFARVEQFLAKHLGGRSERWVDVPGATAEVK